MILRKNSLNQWFLKYFSACLICMLLLFGIPAKGLARPSSGILNIQSVLYNPQTHAVQLVAQNQGRSDWEYDVVKLSDPERVVVDIPNATVTGSQQNVDVHQDGIDHIELSQTLDTFYQIVHLTIYGTDSAVFGTIHPHAQGNMLSIALSNSQPVVQAPTLPPLPPQKSTFSFVNNPTVTAGVNVLTSATFNNGALNLASQPGNHLVIKNQFTLSAPKRLVIDLANTVLANKQMEEPMVISAGGIETIRIGQFDENTVRIVVETQHPNGFYLAYPHGNKNEVVLYSHLHPANRMLALDDPQVGFIQNINLSKSDGSSIIQVTATNPISHQVVRRGNQVEIDLTNTATKPAFIAYDKHKFPNIKNIRISPVFPGSSNSKIVITLKDPQTPIDSNVSIDGHTLELALTSSNTLSDTSFSDTWASQIPIKPFKKGVFTVVIDPGHGGKDFGAMRDGVYEKTLNLEVGLKVRKVLEAMGIKVYMRRTSDVFTELSGITDFTNSIHPDAFVSIHTNASVDTNVTGITTYYYTPQSRQLAYDVQQHLVNLVSSPNRGVQTARFYVIHHTSVPAILCEMGFISNPTERAELQSEARQRATAEAIAEGVVQFLGDRYKAQASQGVRF